MNKSNQIIKLTEWLKTTFNYQFTNLNLLELALRHGSLKAEVNDELDNERLEFLGDSVLGLVIAEKLYRNFQKKEEGKLTQMRSKLVNNQKLSILAKEIGLDQQVKLGKSLTGQSEDAKLAIYANALEALIGAIYLDSQSFSQTKKAILPIFKQSISELQNIKVRDSKSLLQEYCQAHQLSLPTYQLVSEHNKVFKMGCRVEVSKANMLETYGKHQQKKIAEQIAANEALKQIENNQ